MAKGKWTYIESASLSQTVAYDELSHWLFCKDGTRYSPQEMAVITQNWTLGAELPPQVHAIKKLFGGEIISAEQKH